MCLNFYSSLGFRRLEDLNRSIDHNLSGVIGHLQPLNLIQIYSIIFMGVNLKFGVVCSKIVNFFTNLRFLRNHLLAIRMVNGSPIHHNIYFGVISTSNDPYPVFTVCTPGKTRTFTLVKVSS
jgi:hypothetical protein